MERSDSAVEERVITPEPWPDLTAKEAVEYRDQQIPYLNYAGHEELAKRALTTYQQSVMKCSSDTAAIRENWLWIDYVFRANSLRRTTNRDVHVPELLKMHRALIPRLVEAFLGGGGSQFFAAKGRDVNDRKRGYAITAMLEEQLEANNFRSLLAPFAASVCKYQVGIFKVVWEQRTQRVPYHWVETSIDHETGEVSEVHRRQWKDVVTFVGNKVRLVDPARAIIDAQRWDVGDMAYFGDISHRPLHEIINEKQLYKNLDQLLERRKSKSVDDKRVTPSQSARSGLRRNSNNNESPFEVRNTSEFVEIGEWWGWFNWAPHGADPDMRQTIITVADNGVVLRLQENFHDDKHLPYAIARYSDNGFEFFDVGLYDPALRIQDEIDHFRGTMYEAAELILAPRAFTKGPAADIPSNIYDMPAGYIGKDVGDIVFQPIPNTLQSAPFIDSLTRRDMEEITGVPRLWQGTESGEQGSQETATAVRRKIEEGNRRLLGLVKSLDDGCVALLKKMHANNEQFMARKTSGRVLNARLAKLLGGEEWELRPSELIGPVDFTFLGVRRIQQYGLRGTNLLTFLQVMAPMLVENPEAVNIGPLIRQVYSAVVGEEVDDEILNDDVDLDEMNDQADENRLLIIGQRVPIHPMDNDAEHIRKMDEEITQQSFNRRQPEIVRRAIAEHRAKHEIAMRKKAAKQAAIEQQRQQAAADAEGAKMDEAPPAGGLERGKRQTNGDGTPQQVSKSGRRAPITQANNGS